MIKFYMLVFDFFAKNDSTRFIKVISLSLLISFPMANQISIAQSGVAPPIGFNTPQGTRFTDCADCPIMVVVPAGSFVMGSDTPEREWFKANGNDIEEITDEIPRRKVRINEPFAVGAHEITRGQYRKFISNSDGKIGTISRFITSLWWGCTTMVEQDTKYVRSLGWENPGFEQSDDHPVVCIPWEEAQRYAKWLSKKTGQSYRLLSEAEWEYSARAGTSEIRYWGNDWKNATGCKSANLSDKNSGWSNGFSCTDPYKYTAPVGKFLPNGFGLYDMLGNVWEWVADCYSADAYKNHRSYPAAMNKSNCKVHVRRGGAWNYRANNLRVANRSTAGTPGRNSFIGFRVARNLRKRI
jgi:formylglycine-generating enzyme